jgi:hypothetical protein
MNAWINFVGYQLAWFGVVAAAGRGHPGLACAAAGGFVAIQMALSDRRILDLRLMLTAVVLGVSIDGALSALGWIRYAAPEPALPPGGAPLWILALWGSFALTLTRSLAWLSGHAGWAAVFGALGGPIAYWSASRGFHAVRFLPPSYPAVGGLAIGWSGAMAILARMARRPA